MGSQIKGVWAVETDRRWTHQKIADNVVSRLISARVANAINRLSAVQIRLRKENIIEDSIKRMLRVRVSVEQGRDSGLHWSRCFFRNVKCTRVIQTQE